MVCTVCFMVYFRIYCNGGWSWWFATSLSFGCVNACKCEAPGRFLPLAERVFFTLCTHFFFQIGHVHWPSAQIFSHFVHFLFRLCCYFGHLYTTRNDSLSLSLILQSDFVHSYCVMLSHCTTESLRLVSGNEGVSRKKGNMHATSDNSCCCGESEIKEHPWKALNNELIFLLSLISKSWCLCATIHQSISDINRITRCVSLSLDPSVVHVFTHVVYYNKSA